MRCNSVVVVEMASFRSLYAQRRAIHHSSNFSYALGHARRGKRFYAAPFHRPLSAEKRALNDLAKKFDSNPELTMDFVACLSNDTKLRIANKILGEQRDDGSKNIDYIAGHHRRAIAVREVSMSVGKELALEAGAADRNKDGIVSSVELNEWLRNIQKVATSKMMQHPKEVTRKQLRELALVSGIPFIGFGFLDNSIMLIAGDWIELSLGLLLGISTLACAALGNLVADVIGLGANTVIETLARQMGLQDPKLSLQQMRTRKVKMVQLMAATVGITIGCILGMFPLLFMDTKKSEKKHPETAS